MANARVDVFNSNFALVKTPGEFRDPKLPQGYAPFGIQELGGKIYVAYGKQNKQKTDVVAGAGLGVVDVYNVNGKLLHHLVGNGPGSPLDAPWGLAIAPKGFGPFAGDLLVGNLGNGWINAFNPTTGKYLGALDTTKRHPDRDPRPVGNRGRQLGVRRVEVAGVQRGPERLQQRRGRHPHPEGGLRRRWLESPPLTARHAAIRSSAAPARPPSRRGCARQRGWHGRPGSPRRR